MKPSQGSHPSSFSFLPEKTGIVLFLAHSRCSVNPSGMDSLGQARISVTFSSVLCHPHVGFYSIQGRRVGCFLLPCLSILVIA